MKPNAAPENKNNAILKRIGITSAFLFIAAITLLISGLFLRAAAAVLIIADPIEKADAALVLSGSDSTRIDEAARLYHEQLVKYVILTEEGIELSAWNTNYSNLMRFRAIQMGIPESAIWITEQHVDSTTDEAHAALKLIRQRGLKSVIVITDPYHTLRTRLIFRDVFDQEDIRVSVHPTSAHWYRSTSWWLHAEGWRVTLLEYIKLIGYFLGIK